ncbi:hypothetical protein MDA_GLEAN10020108 [Myotis davidii]|uniref:Uncharacterized protein n=1 Tax=Myotis davidii TaxID=225400 RepID=L5LJS8_MYODS|nr:hypothetical protein MDA_GLEAN10020108 [Myotis davidii]
MMALLPRRHRSAGERYDPSPGTRSPYSRLALLTAAAAVASALTSRKSHRKFRTTAWGEVPNTGLGCKGEKAKQKLQGLKFPRNEQ